MREIEWGHGVEPVMVTTCNTGSLRYTLGTKRISCTGAYTYIELSHGKLGLDAAA